MNSKEYIFIENLDISINNLVINIKEYISQINLKNNNNDDPIITLCTDINKRGLNLFNELNI